MDHSDIAEHRRAFDTFQKSADEFREVLQSRNIEKITHAARHLSSYAGRLFVFPLAPVTPSQEKRQILENTLVLTTRCWRDLQSLLDLHTPEQIQFSANLSTIAMIRKHMAERLQGLRQSREIADLIFKKVSQI